MSTFWSDAYYINLDSRPDRRLHIESELSRVGIQATRFAAIGPSKWEGKRPAPSILRKRKPGNSGCYKSHCQILRRVIATQKTTLILEDDCLFSEDFTSRLPLHLAALPPVWDIFFLNATFHYPTPYWHRTGDAILHSPLLWRTYGLFGTQSYIINGTSASKLLSMMAANLHHAYAIDHLLIRLQPRLFCFAPNPGLTTQYDNHSDITQRFAPFSGHHRLGPHVWPAQQSKDTPCSSPTSEPATTSLPSSTPSTSPASAAK